nr:hypothetical protein [Desulfobacterales bacterium]
MDNHTPLTEWNGGCGYWDCISPLPLHNADFLFGQAEEFINHPVNLFFVFPDVRLFGGVLQIIVVFGDGEDFVDQPINFVHSARADFLWQWKFFYKFGTVS